MDKIYSESLLFSLLDNDSFVRWLVCPTPESDAFWENEIDKSDELREIVSLLKNIIKKTAIEEPFLSVDKENLLWKNIKQLTQKPDNKKERKTIPLRKWMRIASSVAVVVLACGYWYYTVTGNKTMEPDYTSILNDDIKSLRSENISLILSNDKVIDIRDDSSTVVYDRKGKVNINSEQVEETGNKNAPFNQLIVPYGKTTTLTLSDGTKVWVNSGSRLVYPSVFDKNKREIYLMGEIYLDVVKNKESPFIIKTNHLDVTVLGTKLNVSAYRDAAVQHLTLVSGKVSVKSKEMQESYNVLPNQAFSYDIASKDTEIREVDVNNYISWIYGYLLLQYENLDGVIQKLEKHYNISITYDASDFKNIRISGKLDLDKTLESALRYISIVAPVCYKIDDGRIKMGLSSKNK